MAGSRGRRPQSGLPSISYHTDAGALVYEPFSGSGSQLIAAAKMGRRCFAMELAPEFVDVARIRWTNFARLAGIDAGSVALIAGAAIP